MSDRTNTPVPDALSYKNLVDLMALYSEAVGRMGALENELQAEFLALVDLKRDEYSKLQHSIAESEEAIEDLAVLNPQWFVKAKTLKTPYGTVGFRKTTKLEVKNEEVSIVLIRQAGEEAADLYIRSKEELNLEALEKLDDSDLKKFRITRSSSDACTVKAAKIDLGKAVKKAAEQPA